MLTTHVASRATSGQSGRVSHGEDAAVDRAHDLLRVLGRDEATSPAAFHWRGRVEQESLDAAPAIEAFRPPLALRELWLRKGFGELYESEEILSPVQARERVAWHAAHGLDRPGVLFYEGALGVAFAQPDGRIVTVGPIASEDRMSEDLLAWYRDVVRAEFANRYGLPVDA